MPGRAPLRVLHIITGLGAGGAEQQLRLMLRHLPVACDVITLTNPGAVARGIISDGTRVLHLGMEGNRDLSALPRLVTAIRAGRYDLVHTHLYRACVFGRVAARTAGIEAVLATEHSLGASCIEGRPLTPGTRALYLATERLGSSTVAVSATVADRLRAWGVPRHRIDLIPNGIDARHFRYDPAARAIARARLDFPEHAFVAGGVGRLVPGKRFDILLRSVAELPGARLLLVGDGPERASLERLAVQLGVERRVRMLGERDGAVEWSADRSADIPGLLAAMDVFVSPSSEESFGLAVIEALAAGLRVLHVICPAIDELQADEAPGARRIALGVPPLVAALAEAMHEHERAGAGARRLPAPPAVARYDIARSAELLADLYERTAATRHQGGRGAFPSPYHHALAVSRPKR
ncbi:glycosyltransferase [Streptomyces sp. NPDC048639]|uniref:glycosyltransferase n=1 Tax=Streptomyces sp. NPDC048639 TaxID=3365581 RepID=UPI003722379A